MHRAHHSRERITAATMRALHRTLFWTRLQNSLPTPSTPTAAVLTSPTPASNLLSRLLPPHVPILTTTAHALPSDLRNPVHTIPSSPDLRPAAAWALRNSIRDLILPTTRIDHALTALTTNCTQPYNGLEVLPFGTVRVHHPLINVHEDVLDATATTLLPPPHPSFQRLAQQTFNDVDVSAILRHTNHKQHSLDKLHADSTSLLQHSVVEASHWGYVVLRRSALSAVYHDSRASLCAIHALSRVVQHVSGSSHPLPLQDPQVSRLAAELFRLDQRGQLEPLPKGRTAAGVVVRPATGGFARRLSADAPHDLMILSREPDNETAKLHATRLRGNYSCAPLGKDGVYWDNRFVIMAGLVRDLSEQNPPLRIKDVFLAVLDPQEDIAQRLTQTSLYVRQIRRLDWERVTAATTRVRDYHLPFQCIRALPAIFEKEAGSIEQGQLIASPHLGISSRSDMYFTAVCMPRFRTLPEGICPGFVDEYIGDQEVHYLT